jgi:GR25 family glycosyltransferase involved in LPS biosynthesis/glycosyltransferase involved in cell wall biosynthesis
MKSKPNICFSIGYTPDFNHNLNGVYGAEFALKNLAEEFSKTHNVYVFGASLIDSFVNNVYYFNSNYLNKFMSEKIIDIMIVSRYIFHFLEFDNKPLKTYIWLHDTIAHPAWNGLYMAQEGKFLLQNIIHKIDGIVVLTEWHKQFVKDHYNLDESKIYIIGNAIDTTRYDKQVERVQNRFIYTSNPNRGLKELVENFSSLKEKIPDAELWVYRGEDDFIGEYKDLLELIKTIPYIKFMGRFNNNDLVEHQMMADFWYYPTNWSETYCISALESMAAGCICITSDLAALKDTIGDRGILLKNSIYSKEYFEEAEEKILEFLNNENNKENFRIKGSEWAKKQSWTLRVKEWFKMFGYENETIFPIIETNKNENYSIIVINLERRPDRWENFVKHADKIGLKNYKRFDATDGKKLVIDEETSKIFHIKEGFVGKRWKNLTHNYYAGTLGCALSHLRIWKEVCVEDKDYIVFEDDVILDDDFVQKWNDIYENIKNDLRWDILFFGIYDDEYGESLYGDKFVHPNIMKFSPIMRLHGGGTFGYVIRPKGAKKFIELVDKLGIQQPIDHFMIDHFDSLCVYKTVPHLAKAFGTDTDIQNCTMKIEDSFLKLNII